MNYAFSFLLTIAIGAYSNFDLMYASDIPNYFLYWGMVATVLTTPLLTWWYLGAGSVLPNAKTGLMFGVTMFLVTFLMDLSLFASFFLLHFVRLETFLFYTNPLFWVSTSVMLALASMSAEWMRKRHLKTRA